MCGLVFENVLVLTWLASKTVWQAGFQPPCLLIVNLQFAPSSWFLTSHPAVVGLNSLGLEEEEGAGVLMRSAPLPCVIQGGVLMNCI